MATDKSKKMTRRTFLKTAAATTAAASPAALAGCKGKGLLGSTEAFALEFQEYFKSHYRLMTDNERQKTVSRLERLAKIRHNLDTHIDTEGPRENVLFGYAFNVTRCEGYMECVKACVKENNLDRKSNTQYIRILKWNTAKCLRTRGTADTFIWFPGRGTFIWASNASSVKIRPASKPVQPRPPGKSLTAWWWWIMTGASAAGIAWRPALTGAEGITGTSPRFRKKRSTPGNITWETGCG